MALSPLLSLGVIGGADGPTAIFVTGPDAGTLPLFLIYLLLINLLTFLIYGLDKHKARQDLPRIAERTLLMLAVLGGSLGAWLGMHLFRHKTKHWYFRYGIPLILLAQIALGLGIAWLLR